MGETSGIGGSTGGLWYRVRAVDVSCVGGTAVSDYASVLPAALNAARHRRPFIAGWLSRGGGAPLELITTAGPLPEPDRTAGAEAEPGSNEAKQPDAEPPAEMALAAVPSTVELLFPWGARGVAIDSNMLADLDQLVWAPCPGRQVPLTGDGSLRQ